MNTKHIITVLALITFSATAGAKDKDKNKKLADFEALQKKVEQHLKVFDDLDFNVFSNQEWNELGRSHSKDVKVHCS